MFFTVLAVFFQNQFFLVFQLILAGNIVLALADLTDESQKYALFFFCHIGDYRLAFFNGQEGAARGKGRKDGETEVI